MQLPDLRDRRVAIMGLGREGQAVVAVAQNAGAKNIIGIDDTVGAAWKAFSEQFPEIPLYQGEEIFTPEGQNDFLNDIDIIVKSPGISKLHPFIIAAKNAHVKITGSTQLWLSEHAPQTVAVTGSKGKSTTASLIAHLAEQVLGWDIGFGGNIGIPLFTLPPKDHYIVELGSYQSSEVLHSPHTVILTALFPEHLDWHGSVDEYYRDKLNLAAHSARRVLINGRDARLHAALEQFYPDIVFDQSAKHLGVWIHHGDNGPVFMYQERELFSTAPMKLVGEHNAWNVALALTWLAEHINIFERKDQIADAVYNFHPLESRLTAHPVALGNVEMTFVDDSLSTSPYATLAALESFRNSRIVLLLGGQDRGVDYQQLIADIESFAITAIVVLPGADPHFLDMFSHLDIPLFSSTSMQEAVTIASGQVQTLSEQVFDTASSEHSSENHTDHVVLLSPAAPSYGHFVDYRDRSAQFVAAIETIISEHNTH